MQGTMEGDGVMEIPKGNEVDMWNVKVVHYLDSSGHIWTTPHMENQETLASRVGSMYKCRQQEREEEEKGERESAETREGKERNEKREEQKTGGSAKEEEDVRSSTLRQSQCDRNKCARRQLTMRHLRSE
eukprot:Gb_35596 [translate_table: standard]